MGTLVEEAFKAVKNVEKANKHDLIQRAIALEGVANGMRKGPGPKQFSADDLDKIAHVIRMLADAADE